jgi:hypothetical protein
MFLEELLHGVQNFVTRSIGRGSDVYARGMDTRGQRPEMHVVNFFDTRKRQKPAAQDLQVHFPRGTFEEDVARLAQQAATL